MGYVKLVKNRNYYKRFKVKMKRRRQAKTDYGQRRRLIKQDRRKYNAPKWRFIVRITNSDVICQVASSKMIGDHILCAAYSHELKRYGLKVGLTNYAACYCTGLLLARRLLKKLKLDKAYPGKKSLDGNLFKSHMSNVHWSQMENNKIFRPFKCILDLGLARPSKGARVFGALKGAVDGGLDIPHSERRFPGFIKGKGDQKNEYQADVHAEKIFGGHVRDYMLKLREEDTEKYNRHFRKYIEQEITPENLADKLEDVHKKIRENPSAAPKKKRDLKSMKLFPERPKKLTAEERLQRRLDKIEALAKAGQEEADNAVQAMNVDSDEN